MDLEQFKDEYNLEHLERIEPVGKKFKMWITPRFHDAYEREHYEDLASTLLLSYAPKIDLFIDVGAHYGYFSLLIGTANPNCRILAYEPGPENYEILKRNLELNDIYQATAYNQAVSNQSAQALFNISTASDNCSFIQHPATPVLRQIEVETIALQEVLAGTPFTNAVIKIDTDGHDLQVLEGCEEALRSSDNIQLLLELNPKCCYLAGSSPEAILNKLNDLGYECYYLNENERSLYRPENAGVDVWRSLFDEKSYVNLLCKKKSKSINTLIFTHSSALAGAERSLVELVKELIGEYGTMCTVVLPAEGPIQEYLHAAGAATIIAPMEWWCTGGETLDQATIDNLYAPSYAWLIENHARLELINPDIVLTNTLVIPWGALAAIMLQRPHLWMINEFGEAAGNLKFFLPFPEVLEFVEQSSDQIVTRSQAVQQKLFPTQDSTKVKTIYRYIEAPRNTSTPESIENGYFRLENNLRVFIPATVMEIKRQEDAVRSVIELVKNRNRNVELLISGHAEPKYRAYIESLISAENAAEYIRLIPFEEHLLAAYNSADIVLVCSRMEAFSRVILEAQLLEKPVIATNTGGNFELIVDGETGLLYSPGDYIQLADQIEKLLDNPDLRADLARNSKRFAETMFTKERFGGEYQKTLVELKNSSFRSKGALTGFISAQNASLFRYLSARIADRDASIRLMTSKVEGFNAEMNRALERSNQEIIQLQEELSQTRRQLDLAMAELLGYVQSNSWRITRPLRSLRRMVRGR